MSILKNLIKSMYRSEHLTRLDLVGLSHMSVEKKIENPNINMTDNAYICSTW